MSPRKSPQLLATENDTELTRLREQVRLLTAENERLRSFIEDHDIAGAPQPETVKVNNADPREKRSTQRFIKARSPNTPARSGTPRATGRGCSCKGNCSTRICGCVKKNIPCAEFCRCGDELCQNSEPDKENIGHPNQQPQLSEDAAESLTKLSKLALGENEEFEPRHPALEPMNKMPEPRYPASEPVNKPLQRIGKPRGLFSPDIDGHEFTFEETADIETANISLHFGDVADDRKAEEGILVEKASNRKKNKKKTKKEKNGKNKENSEKNMDNTSNAVPASEVPTPIKDSSNPVRDPIVTTLVKDISNTALDLKVTTPVKQKDEVDFDPMKPRRQLSRSPGVSQTVPRTEMLLDVAEVPLPAPLKEEPEEEPPEPEELKQDIVEDWDRHMANLVECTKCGRKLYPHRIKKHEASCQNI